MIDYIPIAGSKGIAIDGCSGSGRLARLQPFLQVVRTANVLAINENLRIRGRIRYSAKRPVRVVAVENELLEFDPCLLQ